MRPRTLNQHLPHIHDKLEVQTGTAAAAIAGRLLLGPLSVVLRVSRKPASGQRAQKAPVVERQAPGHRRLCRLHAAQDPVLRNFQYIDLARAAVPADGWTMTSLPPCAAKHERSGSVASKLSDRWRRGFS
jgi:hypothetical protein